MGTRSWRALPIRRDSFGQPRSTRTDFSLQLFVPGTICEFATNINMGESRILREKRKVF